MYSLSSQQIILTYEEKFFKINTLVMLSQYCFAISILNTAVKNNFSAGFRDFIYMCKYEYASMFASVCRGQEKASDKKLKITLKL